jgi:hypothetical protein
VVMRGAPRRMLVAGGGRSACVESLLSDARLPAPHVSAVPHSTQSAIDDPVPPAACTSTSTAGAVSLNGGRFFPRSPVGGERISWRAEMLVNASAAATAGYSLIEAMNPPEALDFRPARFR